VPISALLVGLDLDGVVAAGDLDELADGPAGLVLDPAADCARRDDDGQIGLDRVAQAVVDRQGRPGSRRTLDCQRNRGRWRV